MMKTQSMSKERAGSNKFGLNANRLICLKQNNFNKPLSSDNNEEQVKMKKKTRMKIECRQ